MGVKGAGLRADGLHKSFVNGSPEQHGSASHKTRTGGGVTDSQMRADGMHKRGLSGNVAEEHNAKGNGAFGNGLMSKDARVTQHTGSGNATADPKFGKGK